jgi:hypothetical protein
MTDEHRLDITPRAEFADRLERDLLDALGTAQDRPRQDDMVNIETHQHSSRASRTPWLIAAAAVVLGVVGVTIAVNRDQSSSASLSPSTTTTVSNGRSVTFTVDWSEDGKTNDCAATKALACLYHFAIPGVAPFEGDVAGTSYQAVFWSEPDLDAKGTAHVEHVATYMVNATVKGCGSGRFMLEELVQYAWPNDHEDQGTYRGTWTVVPHSGRGDLVKLSGSGTSEGPPSGARTLSGAINCG